jgi:hypothetical protein
VFICLLHDGQSPEKTLQNYNFACCFVCAAWSVTLREENGLLVFEDGVMEMFLSRMGKLTGFREKLHTESLHFSASIT